MHIGLLCGALTVWTCTGQQRDLLITPPFLAEFPHTLKTPRPEPEGVRPCLDILAKKTSQKIPSFCGHTNTSLQKSKATGTG